MLPYQYFSPALGVATKSRTSVPVHMGSIGRPFRSRSTTSQPADCAFIQNTAKYSTIAVAMGCQFILSKDSPNANECE